MTIGWLYCECMRKLIEAIDSDTKDPDLTYKPEDFIMLKTVKKIHNLDFYLTQHDQQISKQPGGIEIKPYQKKNIDFKDRNTIKNYKLIAKIGDGGFSSVFLGIFCFMNKLKIF